MDWNRLTRFNYKLCALLLIPILLIVIIIVSVSKHSGHSSSSSSLVNSNQTKNVPGAQTPSPLSGPTIESNDSVLTWSDGMVPYEFDPLLNEAKLIFTQAMKFIESKTCIKFIEKSTKNLHWLKFVRNDEICYSAQIGRKSSTATSVVEIGLDCITMSMIQRVLALTLGLGYEQTRPDRKRYVRYYPGRKECQDRLPLLITNGNNNGASDVDSRNETKLLTKISNRHTQQALGIVFDPLSHLFLAKECFLPIHTTWTRLGSTDYSSFMDPSSSGSNIPISGISTKQGQLSVLDIEKLNAIYNCTGCNSYRFVHIRKIQALEDHRTFESWNPIESGVDIDRQHKLHICRVYHRGSLLIGKMKMTLKNNDCWVSDRNNFEYIYGKGYEVMTSPMGYDFKWNNWSNQSTNIDFTNAVIGGRNNDREPIYIGKCELKTPTYITTLSGSYFKDDNGTLKVPFGGKEEDCVKFQLLSCK